jgi:hypothetical protein
VADIFQEVEEDVRRDRAMVLYRRYGPYAIGAAVALVVAVAGYTGWKEYDISRRAKASMRFETASNEVRTDKAKAAQSFEAIAADAPGPYDQLARLRQAQLKAEAGERDAAASLFGTAAGSLSQPEMRDLAVLLALLQRFDTAPPEELRESLKDLAQPGRPMRPSALELQAALALRSNDHAQAREILTGLTNDITTPPAMRQRATDLLSFIPGDKK